MSSLRLAFERHVFWLWLSALVAFALWSSGCSAARSPSQHECSSACSTLVALGSTIVWAGGIVCTLSALAAVATNFVPFLAGFRTIFVELGILGGCAVLVGTCFIWLGDHLWILGITLALVAGGLCFWYWPKISRLIRNRTLSAQAVDKGI